MSPKERASRERDWYKVSVETLRGWGIFFSLLVLAGLGFFGYGYWESFALRHAAERVIDQDRALFQQLQGDSASLDSFKKEYDTAWGDLENARQAFGRDDFRQALDLANRSREVLLSITNATRNKRESGEAQFIAVQGKVEFRRGERGDWEPARGRVVLRSGDYVKTAANGSSEIMFVDGTLYTVRPNTLFLVTSDNQGGHSGEQSIQLQYGWINLNTAQRPSRIATPQAQARVANESEAVVAYDTEKKKGSFTTYKGSMDVAAQGGQKRRVAALQTVTQEGALLSQPQGLPAAPVLVEPRENEDVDFDKTKKLTLAWKKVTSADKYALQVSRNRLFVDNIIDASDRKATQATLGLQGEGTFLWRVAAINGQDLKGPWSDPQRFRVASRKGAGEGDRVPPELTVEDIQSYGSIFIVSGKTETGASVFINGESVVVEANGSFTKTIQLVQPGWAFIEIKATDAWGNEATERKRVFVENL